METIRAKTHKPEKPKEKVTEFPTMLVQRRIDFQLLVAVLGLSLYGLIMILSASYYRNLIQEAGAFATIKSQLVWYILGIVCLVFLANFKNLHKLIDKLTPLIFISALALLIMVLLFGKTLNGAKRWIVIFGVSFQPSEFAKFALILAMSAFMAKRPKTMSDKNFIVGFLKGVLPMLVLIGAICGLIFLQPNKSTAIIIGATAVVLLIMGGIRMRFASFYGVARAGSALFMILKDQDSLSSLTSFKDPFLDPSGTGYQTIQSLYAIASGGLFGTGLGMSKQKLLFLPYADSDYIFSIICEETGFIGAMFLITLYVFIFYRGIKIALTCRNRFGSLLAAGISFVFIIQAFINIAVSVNLIPSTGQTLPFMSAGGTSLLIYMCAYGVLLNISKDCEPTRV
ncbi:MAG: cell division protein FtsW [Clostridiales bacterium]|nr:cell division protein FtsW [Clostridiales bacterium]